jgi:hypothetical protein
MKNFIKNNRFILGISLFPLVLIIESMLFTLVTSLLTEASDIAVVVGVISLCLLILGNLLFFKFLVKLYSK